jgi:adenylate kinase
MQKHVILFYGPPGAGKGTQAEKVAAKCGFSHFDTGKFVEKVIHDESLLKKSAVVRKQRRLFMSGKLADPAWAGAEVKKQIKKFASEGKSLVMSGSPRTMEEAFELKGGGVADALIRNYGLENILIIFLTIPVSESVKRNSKRGRAGLDEPAVIRVRCREYAKRTLPVIKEMKRRGIKAVKIDGVPPRGEVERAVRKAVKEFFQCQKSNLKMTCRCSKPRDAS